VRRGHPRRGRRADLRAHFERVVAGTDLFTSARVLCRLPNSTDEEMRTAGYASRGCDPTRLHAEPEAGIEPATCRLRGGCSAAELLRPENEGHSNPGVAAP